ncbi:MAG: 16S rRNA (guanine(966)-N(2))-methyltransferase RsmD [Anaerolineales bacterium]|nr:16S rRNA (guanine(966)-N(2))-methyltransferase RsmD [Anaerolineales bacterium]
MRVISGRAKGFKLKTVPGEGTRPITDRVKESLFNIIGPDIEGAAIWDLFAGTGSVGIEALSRGASFARFTDTNNKAIGTVRENLRICRLGEVAEIRKGNVLPMLEQAPDRSFEYLYIAPPQYKDLWQEAMKRVDARPGWMVDDAWVIVQIHPVEYQPRRFVNLAEFDQRKYGSTLLVFYEAAKEITS